MNIVAKTEAEFVSAIKNFYPEGTGAEHSLIKLDLILKSVDSSLSEVTDSMKIPETPFLKLASRK